MLINREQALLVLIDVQEKLSPLVRESQTLIERCAWALNVAQDLKLPILCSEQYPKGLGQTLPVLSALIPEAERIEKLHFSCYSDTAFVKAFKAKKAKQAILIGLEAHVCILQTALDMLAAGIEVFILVDAVSSRFEQDQHYALKRMKQAGAQLISSEMFLFECLRQAGTEEFRHLSKKYLQRAEAQRSL